jgi:HrpA-like RNA helicase
MGIRGLQRWVEENTCLSDVDWEELKAGATLLVDGSGLAIHLLDKLCPLGGDYSAYDAAVSLFVGLARDAQLKLVVYKDGKINRMKADTHHSRTRQRQEDWEDLRMYCNDGNSSKSKPFPPLFSWQFYGTLECLGVEIFKCEEEADQKLAIDCSRMPNSYILAMDSDFYLFPNCNYIALSNFEILDAGAELLTYNIPSVARAKVWTRAKLAELTGLSEAQVVEWGLILGNDFTGHFPAEEFDGIAAQNDRQPEALLEVMLRDKAFTAKSRWAELTLALEFSRDFYNGESLEDYPIDGGAPSAEPEGINDPELFNELQAGTMLELQRIVARVATDPVHAQAILHILSASPAPEYTDEVFRFPTIQWADIVACWRYQRCLRTLKDKGALGLDKVQPQHLYSPLFFAFVHQQRTQEAASAPIAPQVDTSTDTTGIIARFFVDIHTAFNNPTPDYQTVIMFLTLLLQTAAPTCHTMTEFKDANAVNASGLLFLVVQISQAAGDCAESAQAKEVAVQILQQFRWRENLAAAARTAALAPPPPRSAVSNGPDSSKLPIDDSRGMILHHIQNHRVTIITGETGCGKSSRIPEFLVKQHPDAMMMIAQPRRIAVQGLLKRMRQQCGDVFGMRMGHGVSDQGRKTRAWYVTTGYLVRLLAHHPDAFDRHTHLIIDEVHERSIDGDLLCLLARNLLKTHPTIKLILMSATVATDLYSNYFDVNPDSIIFVGARRFPVDIHHLEELCQVQHITDAMGRRKVEMLPRQVAKVKELIKEQERSRDLSPKCVKLQQEIAVMLLRHIARPGVTILIFVTGLDDIVTLAEKISDFDAQEVYRVLPIHSEIPFDNQQAIFDEEPSKVTVVIATNAVESSITIPNLDHVICLGSSKQVQYDEEQHRQTLMRMWISKASSIQRAGRTGRLRPGTVYRLYSHATYNNFRDHEISEVLRTPMDQTILTLKTMFNEQPVAPVLENTLEPPSLQTVDRSFNSLYDLGMLSDPSDGGTLTAVGRISSQLPVDLRFGRVIYLAQFLDILPHTLVCAAALTLPKSPFRIAHPLIHTDPNEYNDIVSKVFEARNGFDQGDYSEPVLLARVYKAWQHTRDKSGFCFKNSLASARMAQFNQLHRSLVRKVSHALDLDEDSLATAPTFDDPNQLNLLRLLLVIAFPNQIITANHFANQGGKGEHTFDIDLPPKLTDAHLETLLPDSAEWTVAVHGTTMFQVQQVASTFDDISNVVVILQVIIDVQLTWVVDSDEVITIWVHDDVEDMILSQVQRDDWERTDVRAPHSRYQSKSKAKSKTLLKLLKKAVASTATSFYVNKIERASTQLNCRGCKLNEVQIRQLFGAGCTWKAQGMPAKRVLQLMEKEDRGALIKEMPFIARLLLSMQHRNGSIKVPPGTSVPVGGTGYGEAAKKDAALELKIKLPRPKWAPAGDMSLGRGSHVVVGNYTMTNAAVQLAKEPIYAVASSVMALGKGGQTWLADGVTLLPPGNKGGWLLLARACAPSLEDEEEAAAKVEPVAGCEMDMEKFLKARELAGRFQTLMSYGRLSGDPKCARLLADLAELFAEYVPSREQGKQYAMVRAKSKFCYSYSGSEAKVQTKKTPTLLTPQRTRSAGSQGNQSGSGARGNKRNGSHNRSRSDDSGGRSPVGTVRTIKGRSPGRGVIAPSPTPMGQVLARLLVLIKGPQKLASVASLYKKRFDQALDAASIVGSHSLNKLFQEAPFCQHFKLYQKGQTCFVAPEKKTAAAYNAAYASPAAPQLLPSKLMIRSGGKGKNPVGGGGGGGGGGSGGGGYDPRGKPTVIGGMSNLNLVDLNMDNNNIHQGHGDNFQQGKERATQKPLNTTAGSDESEEKKPSNAQKKHAKRSAKKKAAKKQNASEQASAGGQQGGEQQGVGLAPGVAALFQSAGSGAGGVDVD